MRARKPFLLLTWLAVAAPVVGVGQLTVDGSIESTAGGFKFPDGSVQDSAAMDYVDVVVVAKSGGDFETIQAALDSITDAMDGNRHLVWVAPGVYVEPVTMKPFVDIEGAGQNATVISRTGTGSTLVCASNSVLRELKIELLNSTAGAIACNATTATEFRNLTVVSTNGGGEAIGIDVVGASVTLRTVDVEATAASSVARGVGANNAASVVVADSRITSESAGSFSSGVSSDSLLGTNNVTLIDSVIVAKGATDTTNRAVMFLGGGLLTLLRVEAEASGAATVNVGVHFKGTAAISHSRIQAFGTAARAVQELQPGGGSISVEQSVLVGAANALFAVAGTPGRVAGCFLGGSVSGSAVICANNVNKNYILALDFCPL